MTRPLPVARRDLLWLAIAWLTLAALAGVRPLLLPDEGRYIGVAWEMLQHGSWGVPLLDGLPFFHKPPLFYWITGAALATFGPGEWAGRLAPLLGAGVAMGSVLLLTLRWSGRERALPLLTVLIAQPLFYLGGQYANLDMLVAGCISATVALLADAVFSLEGGLPARRSLWAAYVVAGVGMLAKGLIGIVLPAGTVFLWLLVTGRARLVLRLLSPVGALLLLAIAAPWFLAMQWRFDSFLHYFFIVQHVQRFAASGFNNVQPAWFYVALLGLFFAPWLAWMLGSVRAPRTAGGTPDLRPLMACWAGVVVLFFSLPQSKIVGYVLPAVPPLAWLAADGFVRQPRRRWAWWGAAILGGAVSGATLIALTVQGSHSTRPLGLALRDAHRAGEPVVMLGDYLYDLPFYARLREPVAVVEDWQDPAALRGDNWRKELADAAGFDAGLASRTLLLPGALPGLLCTAPRAWFVGPDDALSQVPQWKGTTEVAAHRGLKLWRLDAPSTTPACARTPRSALPSR